MGRLTRIFRSAWSYRVLECMHRAAVQQQKEAGKMSHYNGCGSSSDVRIRGPRLNERRRRPVRAPHAEQPGIEAMRQRHGGTIDDVIEHPCGGECRQEGDQGRGGGAGRVLPTKVATEEE